jgi:hypothetical protein
MCRAAERVSPSIFSMARRSVEGVAATCPPGCGPVVTAAGGAGRRRSEDAGRGRSEDVGADGAKISADWRAHAATGDEARLRAGTAGWWPAAHPTRNRQPRPGPPQAAQPSAAYRSARPAMGSFAAGSRHSNDRPTATPLAVCRRNPPLPPRCQTRGHSGRGRHCRARCLVGRFHAHVHFRVTPRAEAVRSVPGETRQDS